MELNYFTLLHVLISLAGIGAGIGVVAGLLHNQLLTRWNFYFFVMTFLTSASGFFFPFTTVTPAMIVGFISLVVLAGAGFALYIKRLSGKWRSVFVIGSLAALYLNVFVLIVQLFQRFPALQALAPEQSEPPFAVAQGALLVGFIVIGYFANRAFRGGESNNW